MCTYAMLTTPYYFVSIEYWDALLSMYRAPDHMKNSKPTYVTYEQS